MAQIEMNPENAPLIMALMRIVACPGDKRSYDDEQIIINAIQELIDKRKQVKDLDGVITRQSELVNGMMQRGSAMYEVVHAVAHYGVGGLMPVDFVFQARELLLPEHAAVPPLGQEA